MNKKNVGSPAGAAASMVLGVVNGALLSSSLLLGLRCGLWKALSKGDWLTAEEVARRAECNARVVSEWCFQMAASGGLLQWREKKDGTVEYQCSAELSTALMDETSPYFVGSYPLLVNMQTSNVDRMVAFMKTGVGFDFSDGTKESFFPSVMESVHEPFSRYLFPLAVSKIEILKKPGVRCADIGCASGQMMRVLARLNPLGEFHGYDISKEALRYGRQVLEREENQNIRSCINFHLCEKDGTGVPTEPNFDVAITTDVLHDSSRPDAVFAAVFRLLKKPDGLWLIVEPTCAPTAAAQLVDKSSTFKFGISLHGCLPSSMSEGSASAALGTLGCSEEKLRELAKKTGFSSVELIPGIIDPFNSYYIVRAGRGHTRAAL